MMPAKPDYSPIPYGIPDFERIRTQKYYYVDKTMYIPMLEFDASFAFCLRPRRFGKSLLLNMLECYYDVAYAERFDEIFSGLAIHGNPTQEQGKYLVMKFNFSKVNPDPELVQESFNYVCMATVENFVRKYSAILPADTLERLKKERSCDRAMDIVCNIAKEAGRKIYVMIDEYDNFANTILSHNEGAYRTLTHADGFFRFFFNCLKAYATDNSSPVQRIFITGVSPLTLSDVTSGFNIGLNLSMRPKYNGLVGLSESDVCRLFDYYREHTGVFKHTNEELLAYIKPWYDNYCFSMKSLGRDRMFNTDMVLYFMTHYKDDGDIPREMVDVNVSTDYNKMQEIIRFESTYGEKTRMMEELLATGHVCTNINPEFSLADLDSPENLYSLLYYLGMLSFSGDDFGTPVLSIPNEVVRIQYCQYLAKTYENTLGVTLVASKIDKLMRQMARDGLWEPFFRFVDDSMQTVSSIRDYIDGENFIKAFFLATIAVGRENSYYDFPSEQEYGKGYVDLVMSPRGQVKDMYLVELKYCRAGAPDSEVERLRREAAGQLEQYASGPDFIDLVTRRGWRYHKIVIVHRCEEMVVCEKIES